MFERPVSAAEALQGGLVSRTVWPERVQEQARAIAKDIAAQPHEVSGLTHLYHELPPLDTAIQDMFRSELASFRRVRTAEQTKNCCLQNYAKVYLLLI